MDTIRWNGDSVTMIDQRVLPLVETYHTYSRYWDIVLAIKDMEIRGAPAIGIAAGMGIALAAKNIIADGTGGIDRFREALAVAVGHFSASRPTAVNLFWTIRRMKKIIESGGSSQQIAADLEKEAVAILREDVESNRAMGKNGSRFIADGDVVHFRFHV